MLHIHDIVLFALFFIPWMFIRKHDEKNGNGAYKYPLRTPDMLSTIIAYAIFVLVSSALALGIGNMVLNATDDMTAAKILIFGGAVSFIVMVATFIGTAKIGKIGPARKAPRQDNLPNGAGEPNRFTEASNMLVNRSDKK